MTKNSISIAIVISLCFYTSLFAQTQMSLSDVMRAALKNNYSITLLKNDTRAAENNYSLGNAGFLPSLDFNFRQNSTISNTKQSYFDASRAGIDRTGAKENSYTLETALNWTVFDGFNMFAAYDKLEELKNIGELQLALEIESVMSIVIDLYFDIVRQRYLLETDREAVALSEERLRIINSKYELGSASKMEVLQAQVDLNSDKSALLNQQSALENTIAAMNEIIVAKQDLNFTPTDTITINYDLKSNEILSSAKTGNIAMKIVSSQINVANYSLNSTRSRLYPSVSLFGTYNHNVLNSEAGFIKENTKTGLSYGISLSFNLFDGLNTRREIENASIGLENAEIQRNDFENKLNAEITKAYSRYKSSLQLVALESENVGASREHLDIAFEQLRLGVYSALELREAQKNYVSAQSRLISAKYSAKISEKDLQQLSGNLMSYVKE